MGSAPGQRDDRLHIPLAADIANTSASLLFSEPPAFTVEDTTPQTRLDELTEAGSVANTLLEAAEVAAALGGVFLRVTWDASLAARPLLTAVHADSASRARGSAHISPCEYRVTALANHPQGHQSPDGDRLLYVAGRNRERDASTADRAPSNRGSREPQDQIIPPARCFICAVVLQVSAPAAEFDRWLPMWKRVRATRSVPSLPQEHDPALWNHREWRV